MSQIFYGILNNSKITKYQVLFDYYWTVKTALENFKDFMTTEPSRYNTSWMDLNVSKRISSDILRTKGSLLSMEVDGGETLSLNVIDPH